jgi:hypothetical protein
MYPNFELNMPRITIGTIKLELQASASRRESEFQLLLLRKEVEEAGIIIGKSIGYKIWRMFWQGSEVEGGSVGFTNRPLRPSSITRKGCVVIGKGVFDF